MHPRGLASAAVGGGYTRASFSRDSTWIDFVLRYGITDRLELRNLSLRYAFLDDAPAPPGAAPDGRKRGPLALAMLAGVEGFGYSSFDGWIVIPTVGVEARRHLGRHVYLWSELAWTGWWASSIESRPDQYTSGLWPTGARSRAVVSVGGVVQVVERVSLSLGGRADQLRGCVLPTCDVASTGVSGFAGASFRPWRWMDVAVSGTMGRRDRRDVVVAVPPTGPVAVPPDWVSWKVVALSLTFRW